MRTQKRQRAGMGLGGVGSLACAVLALMALTAAGGAPGTEEDPRKRKETLYGKALMESVGST